MNPWIVFFAALAVAYMAFSVYVVALALLDRRDLGE
jgi:hypothetical protein